ncbi:MerR family transcriptional regulator [Enterococcus sp. DIV0876]|uniref:MerR family transcriptional regulator n=1 Tax=Enterococcus sp. DIV0876 TaxID=2774633 RepID=UPI003D3007C9
MSHLFRNLMENDNLLVGISELSQMYDISPRQLRYWEQKGFIASVTQEENVSRKYRLPTVVKVEMIKRFLDEGFTLAKAVEKADQKIKIAHHIRKVFSGALQNLEVIDNRFTIMSLGPVDEEKHILHIIHDDLTQKLHYELLPEKEAYDFDKLKNCPPIDSTNKENR